ncbi:MAG: hypothetical protein L0H63_12605, partial [Nitrococcus sp.]|nr:hypothetical protein [Nitrococcus sp.]
GLESDDYKDGNIEEAKNALRAASSLIEMYYLKGSVSARAAKAIILGKLGGALARQTIRSGLNDAYKWEAVPGGFHPPMAYDSWINWHKARIDWGKHGASLGGGWPGALTAFANFANCENGGS